APHDRKDVPDADRDDDRHLAHALRPAVLPRQDDEGRRPPEGHLADAIAVRPRDRLYDARLSIDEDRGLGTLARHHAGLDRHGRRADRALATGDVVPAGVDEEEPEAGAGCDRLGHHRDQETPVPAGPEAQTGPEVVEPPLEPAT